MVKNGHGVSSKNNPNRAKKTKKRLAVKHAALDARPAKRK